jgi:23S rRNA (adenine2503-C2)-methyltransferase
MSDRINIRSLDRKAIEEQLLEWGEKPFRARQIYDWLWRKGVQHFNQMRNIPNDLIEKLDKHFAIHALSIHTTQESDDGTLKYGFRMFDNNVVEGVIIPSRKRSTACISSQVGCSLDCSFCATGRLKRIRNLTADEIVDQVFMLNQESISRKGVKLSNIVYMGMGEPLLNYKEVLRSIELLTDPDGIGMSPRRITLSTAGIAKMIRKLGDDEVRFNLALSLHAPTDSKRSAIMSINKDNSLEELREALVYFHQKTNTRITMEYLMLHGFNDTLEDAKNLAHFCKAFPVKINLIEYNQVEGVPFKQSDPVQMNAFASYIQEKNMIVNIRRSRGKDIDAACGQLANKTAV